MALPGRLIHNLLQMQCFARSQQATSCLLQALVNKFQPLYYSDGMGQAISTNFQVPGKDCLNLTRSIYDITHTPSNDNLVINQTYPYWRPWLIKRKTPLTTIPQSSYHHTHTAGGMVTHHEHKGKWNHYGPRYGR